MDDALIFSHTQNIKCCALVANSTIALADDRGISLFSLAKAKAMVEYQFK
jgi:hypothetical protein